MGNSPALAAGHVVIAAPYVDTAVAFAEACGLSERWLRSVLRFAPEATIRALAEERKTDRGWKRRFDRGYPEYCASLLDEVDPSFKVKGTRKAMIACLQDMKGRKAWDLSGRGIEEAARALATDSRPASSSRAAWRPRTARK